MKYSLQEIANHIGARLINTNAEASASVEVNGLASIASASSKDLIFVDGEQFVAEALASNAAALIISPAAAKSASGRKPLLICEQPKLAFSRAARLLAEPIPAQLGVHATAIVHKNAKLGLGASVGALAVLEDSASIGMRTRIGSGCKIAARVLIGSDCVIAPNVSMYSGVTIHDRVIVHSGAVLGSDGFGYVRDPACGKYEKFPQQGRLEIHDDVEIGANTTIDRGALDATVIGRGSKLDNLVHVGHNVRIGENVVIAAQTGISGSCVIEDNVIIGGQVGIGDHVTIKQGAILGAQCGVPSGKIVHGNGAVYWGTPARPLKEHLKQLAALARIAKADKSQNKE